MRFFGSKRGLILSIGGLILGIGIGGAAGQADKTTKAADAKPAPTVTMTVLTPTPPTPTPTVTATQTVAYTPPPPAGYSVIYRFAGRGEKQTEPFTIRANATRWRICYRFTGDTNAVIYLLDGNGEQMELLLNEIGAYADCTTRFEPVGQRYALQLKGNYTITVEETFDP